MKVYIIQRIGFQYDDSRWYESGSGPITKAFRSKQMAEIERQRLDLSAYCIEDIGLYGYQTFLEEYSCGPLREILERYGKIPGRGTMKCDLSDLTEEQLMEVYSNCSLRFYEVIPIEIEDDEL